MSGLSLYAARRAMGIKNSDGERMCLVSVYVSAPLRASGVRTAARCLRACSARRLAECNAHSAIRKWSVCGAQREGSSRKAACEPSNALASSHQTRNWSMATGLTHRHQGCWRRAGKEPSRGATRRARFQNTLIATSIGDDASCPPRAHITSALAASTYSHGEEQRACEPTAK